MNFRKFLKQWLGYSRRERTGSLVLIAILVVVLGVRMLRERRLSQQQAGPIAAFAAGDSVPGGNINADGDRADPFQDRDEGRGQPKNNREGISHNAAAVSGDGRSVKVLAAQDQGRQAASLKSQQWTHTKESAETPRENTGWSTHGTDTPVKGLIDLNRADSAELEALPGIGPVLSVRIIKYRYLVGYFHSVDQLGDVYGLDTEVIAMNRHRFTCDTMLIRKIYINEAPYSDLLRHPYIGEKQVEAIISHRKLAGHLSDIGDLISNRIFPHEELSRLKPYLDFR
jgi:DNA uptake protein ComE-like DNA-binding protein